MALTLSQNQEHTRGHGQNTLHPMMHFLPFESTQDQGSLAFLAPGASFVKDNFSTDGGWDGLRMIQAHYIYVYFISLIITLVPLQVIRHQIPRGWGPLLQTMVEFLLGTSLDTLLGCLTCLAISDESDTGMRGEQGSLKHPPPSEQTEGRKLGDSARGRQEDSRWEDQRDTSSLARSCLNIQYETPSVLLN